jgi:hypothetical protein
MMTSRSRLAVFTAISFSALTTVAQATHVQFSQTPDMVNGTDIVSMHRSNGPVVGDDFIVQKPQIVGLHWWGSYFLNDPALPPSMSRAVQFEVSLHPDCPASALLSAQCPGDPRGGNSAYAYSTPGQPYQFQIINATESFFGVTAGGEAVYEYRASLSTPWDSTSGAIEWLDIAWVAGQFGTDALADVWGWRESDQHHLDKAVQTDRLAPPPGGNPHLGPWNLLQGRDMGFEVITVPETGTLALVGLGLFGLVASRRRGVA